MQLQSCQVTAVDAASCFTLTLLQNELPLVWPACCLLGAVGGSVVLYRVATTPFCGV